MHADIQEATVPAPGVNPACQPHLAGLSLAAPAETIHFLFTSRYDNAPKRLVKRGPGARRIITAFIPPRERPGRRWRGIVPEICPEYAPHKVPARPGEVP